MLFNWETYDHFSIIGDSFCGVYDYHVE